MEVLYNGLTGKKIKSSIEVNDHKSQDNEAKNFRA
jgi:hypothetical protein